MASVSVRSMVPERGSFLLPGWDHSQRLDDATLDWFTVGIDADFDGHELEREFRAVLTVL